MQFGDILKEICKISAVKATAALSKFLQTPVSVNNTLIDVHSDKLEIGKPEDKIISLFLPIRGSINGAALLLYSNDAALSICDKVYKRLNRPNCSFSETEISALSEIANVMVGNFLTTFAKSLQVDLLIHHMAVFNYTSLKEILHQVNSVLSQKFPAEPLRFTVKFECFRVHGNLITFFNKDKILDSLAHITK